MRIFLEDYELITEGDYKKVAENLGDEFVEEINKHKEELEKSIAVRSMYTKNGYLVKLYK